MPFRKAVQASRLIWPPEPGYFALRRHRKAWRVPAQIARDDAGLWCAIIDGVARDSHSDPAHAPDVGVIWHSGIRIPAAEYRYMLDFKAWALDNDPSHPCLHPFEPIDPMQLRPLLPPADFASPASVPDGVDLPRPDHQRTPHA